MEHHGLPDYSDAVDANFQAIRQDAAQPLSPQIQPESVVRPDTEHISTLEDSSSRPWLSLIVKSRSPSPDMAPLVYEDQPISGTAILDFVKPQSIEEVSVSVGAACNSMLHNPHPHMTFARSMV